MIEFLIYFSVNALCLHSSVSCAYHFTLAEHQGVNYDHLYCIRYFMRWILLSCTVVIDILIAVLRKQDSSERIFWTVHISELTKPTFFSKTLFLLLKAITFNSFMAGSNLTKYLVPGACNVKPPNL